MNHSFLICVIHNHRLKPMFVREIGCCQLGVYIPLVGVCRVPLMGRSFKQTTNRQHSQQLNCGKITYKSIHSKRTQQKPWKENKPTNKNIHTKKDVKRFASTLSGRAFFFEFKPKCPVIWFFFFKIVYYKKKSLSPNKMYVDGTKVINISWVIMPSCDIMFIMSCTRTCLTDNTLRYIE